MINYELFSFQTAIYEIAMKAKKIKDKEILSSQDQQLIFELINLCSKIDQMLDSYIE